MIGVVFYILGLIVLIFAGVNFNNLFFVQRLLAKSNIPVYAQLVFIPILAGLVVLLDGSFIANLKRTTSGVLYALGNLAWVYGLYLLYARLSVPVEEIGAYRIVFYAISAGVLVFIVGAIVNDLHKDSKPPMK
jgi:hypothetical protein